MSAGCARLGAALGILLLAAAYATGSGARAAAAGGAGADDPFIWLEDVDGERAMQWVRAENLKSLGVLEQDPRFATLHAEALAIAEATDRLPTPAFLGGQIYNFWQDATHVRGIWRRTSLADYRNAEPRWQTVLDLDALTAAEGSNWFWSGADCERPSETRCLIHLSDGGEDAFTAREFDVASSQFVKDGFQLPKGKQSVAWLGADELLVARDFGPGTMTTSGYPFVVKRLRRGQPLAEAQEVYRGTPQDVAIELITLDDGSGHKASLILRAISTFEAEQYLVTTSGPVRLALPLKSQVDDLVAGRLLVTLREEWKVNGALLSPGSLVAIDLAAASADPQHLAPVPVFVPGPRESLGEVVATRSSLVVTSYQNVRGRAAVFTPTADAGWSRRTLPLPDMASIVTVTADSRSEQAILTVTSFLTPSSYWLVDAASGDLERVKQLPARFDAARSIVEQHEATSKDGTRIPYFVVRPRKLRRDGNNPAILDAYGGFQVSSTPYYSATIGKLWLERGGVFVLANIRGGGEFGPAWHEAGLKTHRQRIYDDFAAVARDLIARRITRPRRLGIEGGSNGGLLMGVEFNQHPSLWHAVDIQVPLLDMLRYEQIAAGASWNGEYGSVANPEERAFLASISPYHNLKAGVRYPLPFIWTTTRDDRVGPQHARKFAARLAALGIPYLYYEVIEGGHASGANLKERAHTAALEMTYFTRQLMD